MSALVPIKLTKLRQRNCNVDVNGKLLIGRNLALSCSVIPIGDNIYYHKLFCHAHTKASIIHLPVIY